MFVCVLIRLHVYLPCVTCNTQNAKTNICFQVTNRNSGLTTGTGIHMVNYDRQSWTYAIMQYSWPKLAPQSSVSYYPSFLVIITHCWSDIVYSPPAHLMILTLILNTSPPSPPRRHAHYIPLFLQYCSIFPHLKFDVWNIDT